VKLLQYHLQYKSVRSIDADILKTLRTLWRIDVSTQSETRLPLTEIMDISAIMATCSLHTLDRPMGIDARTLV
jgi:hypothetical protein